MSARLFRALKGAEKNWRHKRAGTICSASAAQVEEKRASFTGMRGKKAAFTGMRGKKAADGVLAQDYADPVGRRRINSRLQRLFLWRNNLLLKLICSPFCNLLY